MPGPSVHADQGPPKSVAIILQRPTLLRESPVASPSPSRFSAPMPGSSVHTDQGPALLPPPSPQPIGLRWRRFRRRMLIFCSSSFSSSSSFLQDAAGVKLIFSSKVKLSRVGCNDWLIFFSYRTLVEFHPHIQIWSDYRINISTWNVFLSRGVFVWPSIHPHLHPFLVLIWFIISQLLIHFFPFSLFPFHVRLPSPSSSLRRCCCCCCCYGVAYHYTLPQARRVTFKAAPGAPPLFLASIPDGAATSTATAHAGGGTGRCE